MRRAVAMMFLVLWIVVAKHVGWTSLGLFTNVIVINNLFYSFIEVFGRPDFGVLHSELIYPLCDKLPSVKVEEHERLLAKLCTHAQHFPTSNTALLSAFFGIYCNCLPSFTVQGVNLEQKLGDLKYYEAW